MWVAIVALSVVGVMLFGYYLVHRMDLFLRRKKGAPSVPQTRDDGDYPPLGGSSRPSVSPDAERARRTFENDGVWVSDGGSEEPEDEPPPRRGKKR